VRVYVKGMLVWQSLTLRASKLRTILVVKFIWLLPRVESRSTLILIEEPDGLDSKKHE